MSSWHSYPSIYNIGHRVLREFFDYEVQVEEKVDGSQFSFGVFGQPAEDGVVERFELRVRSKNVVFPADAAPALFKGACETVMGLRDRLTPGWTYRGEVLAKPHHNGLAYNRTPKGHIILFDICVGEEDYLSYEGMVAEANRLGLEVVPRLFTGKLEGPDQLRQFLTRESVLGGVTIEGVVCKPLKRDLFGQDKKLLMAKFVSEAFKEVQKGHWKENNPTKQDHIQHLIDIYRTPQRWQKAIQHLRDEGKLEGTPRDIGLLIKEVPRDILKECEEDIKEGLFKAFKKDLERGWTKGLPEFYKQFLLDQQFFEEAA